jgi:hypothetical protein
MRSANLTLFITYRKVLTFVDLFTATGASPAARRIRILPMNQYAFWMMTFGMKITGGEHGPRPKILSRWYRHLDDNFVMWPLGTEPQNFMNILTCVQISSS